MTDERQRGPTYIAHYGSHRGGVIKRGDEVVLGLSEDHWVMAAEVCAALQVADQRGEREQDEIRAALVDALGKYGMHLYADCVEGSAKVCVCGLRAALKKAIGGQDA